MADVEAVAEATRQRRIAEVWRALTGLEVEPGDVGAMLAAAALVDLTEAPEPTPAQAEALAVQARRYPQVAAALG